MSNPRKEAFEGDWYGFACNVLETLRAQVGDAAEPSLVQLWPEHFDLAVELGREGAGFPGAELSYAELAGAGDQRALALEFLSERLAALTG